MYYLLIFSNKQFLYFGFVNHSCPILLNLNLKALIFYEHLEDQSDFFNLKSL